MLPAAISCSSGFHKCARDLSMSVISALPRRPSLSPSMVASSSPPAPPPTTTIRGTALARSASLLARSRIAASIAASIAAPWCRGSAHQCSPLVVENPADFATDKLATHFGGPPVPDNIARENSLQRPIKMKALVYTEPNVLLCREEPEPAPGNDEVLVRVEAVGICGSDMHAYHGHDSRRPPPLVLGHEAAGIVVSGPDR